MPLDGSCSRRRVNLRGRPAGPSAISPPPLSERLDIRNPPLIRSPAWGTTGGRGPLPARLDPSEARESAFPPV